MKQVQEHPNITYLKSQNIGPILAQGIAEVYLKQPKFPIEFFAKWLFNYSKSQDIKKQTVEQMKEKQKLVEQFQEVIKEEERKQLNKMQELFEDNQIDLDFYKLLDETEYHGEMLTQKLPEFLQERKKFTGCYIAVLDYPEKQIAVDDDEEDAHLDKAQGKVLKYIGWSKGHEFLKGKVLGIEEGVTNQVFEEKKEEEVQEGEEVVENQKKTDYIYVENVVKEPKMRFFKIPKLGSYMAVGLSFQSYLSLFESFENGVVANQKFMTEKEEQLKRRQERETEIQDMLREREEAGVEPEEIKQIQDQFETEKQSDPLWVDLVEPEYPSVKKDYVVCVDTLGQDRQIPEKEREYVDNLVKLLGRKWEECERRLLHHDVEQQVSYLEGITANFEQVVENFVTEEDNFIMERQQQLDEFKDKEFELLYETECLRLEKVQQQLQDPDISHYVYMLKDFRMVKYPQLFQIILYLLGYKREQINYPGTNNLN